MKSAALLILYCALSSVAHAIPPANDAFAAPAAMTFNNNDAYYSGGNPSNETTFEPGEAVLALPPNGPWTGSAWWTMTPVQTGAYEITSAWSRVQIFTGTSLNALTPAEVSGQVAWLTAGQTCRLRKLTKASDPPFSFYLTRRTYLDPVNDNVAQARVIPWPAADYGQASTEYLSTAGATAEPGEPAHGGVPAQRTAWVKFTAGSTGAVGLTVNFPRYPVPVGKVALYEEAPLAALTPLTPLLDVPPAGSWRHSLAFPVTQGKTYLLALNDTREAFGPIEVSLVRMFVARYANDDFASRTQIDPDIFEWNARFPAANRWYYGSLEAGEPPAGAGATESLWWEFIAAKSGWYVLSGTDPNSFPEIFRGAALESLVPVTSFATGPNFPGTPPGSILRCYHLEAGQSLIFRRLFSGSGWSGVPFGRADAYSSFILNAGLPLNQSNLWDNPSGDGVNNQTKFIHGLDPSKSTDADPNASRLPRLERRADGGMELVFSADQEAINRLWDYYDSVRIGYYQTSNLTTWQYEWLPVWDDDESTGEPRITEYRFPLPANAPRLFLRMDITLIRDDD